MNEHPHDRVVVLDALTYAGNLVNLDSVSGRRELRFVHGNVCNTDLVESLLRHERLDTLVHFAAESHVDRSISGPDAFIETNIAGTHSLLKASRKVWLEEKAVAAHRFHHISTDEVYGSLDPDESPFTESTGYAPNSPYSASKAASDYLVRAYHRTYGLDVTTSNCSNNYGPYQFPEKLIPLTIVNILQGKPLPVYGDGRNVRDWLHVDDHCRGIDLIISKGQSGEIYNIGGGCEMENIGLVSKLCAIVDAEYHSREAAGSQYPYASLSQGGHAADLITYVSDRPGHDRRYAIDCSKIERTLGYDAEVKLDHGLSATVKWYMSNESWWRAVMDRSYQVRTPEGR